MAVKLDIITNVKGQNGLNKLQSGLNKLGTNATIASKRLKSLEVAAARSRSTFAALGTTLKVGVATSLAAVTFGIGKFVKDTFAAGKLTESLQVRFKLLFNSTTEGAKAFAEMNKFASKVPFSLEAIAAGSGNLAVISKDAGELSKILEVTGNVAAATGLDFRQTAEQIQRAFAGGIAAADVFRERGVRAMLGFEAGAKVSIEETRKKFFEVFANGGQYSKATKDFESTLEAQVSFVQDAYFRFRQAAAKPLFAGVKQQVIDLVGNFKANDTQLKELAKTVGERLADAFKSVENGIRLVATNIDVIIKAFKIFIGLKLGTFIAGIAAQFIKVSIGIKGATVSMHALNLAMRANIIGIIVTAIQGATIAIIAFSDEIKTFGKYLMGNFNDNLNKIKISFLEFKNVLNIGDEDVNLDKIKTLQRELDGTAEAWKKAANAKDAYKEISLTQETRADRFRNFKGPNPRLDMARDDKIKAEKRAKELMSINERIMFTNKRMIIDAAKAATAEKERLANLKSYRDVLKDAGIESKMIADTISSSWLEGLRQGNSLLDITKNAFRNVLLSISDTLVKKSSELLIERLFVSLGNKKIAQQKALNFQVGQQGSLMDTIISKGSGLLSNIGGFLGGGKGGGFAGLFSGVRSIFNFAEGGVVPGGAPYTDRIPAMLTPGEVVIPRNKVNNNSMGSTNITNINISGNVDQRSIDQIKAVIAQSSAEVGGANKTFQRNTQGIRGRNR